MPLRTRFALGMAAMLLPLALAATVSLFYWFPRLVDAMNDVVVELTEEMHPVEHIELTMDEVADALHDYLVHGDAAEGKRFVDLGQEVDRAFEQALVAPYGLEQERALLQAAYGEWRQAKAIGGNLPALAAPTGTPDTVEQIGRLDAHLDQAADFLSQMHDLADQEVAEGAALALAAKQATERLTFTSLVIALGMGAAASIALARSILPPLQALRSGALRYGEGDFSSRVELGRNDEIGQLADAFNSMADRIEMAQASLEAQRAAAALRADEAETLRLAAGAVAAELRPEEAINRILVELERVVPYASASVQLWMESPGRPGEGQLEIVGGRGWPDPKAVVGLRFSVPGDNPNSIVIQRREVHVLGDAPSVHAAFRDLSHAHIHSWLGAPLIVHERLIGMLALDSAQSDYFTADHARLASAFAAQVAITLENARLYAEVERLAITDELTALYNRRYLVEWGAREFARARRYRHPLSAILLDIDHFKRVNDVYGHPVGDQVLRAVGRRIRENLRSIDLVGRYGGEEFVVLLPETGQDEAFLVAERLRRALCEIAVDTSGGSLEITVSLGVATVTEDCPDLPALLERADAAMYAAKRAGRNRVSRSADG